MFRHKSRFRFSVGWVKGMLLERWQLYFFSMRGNVISPENMAMQQCFGRRSGQLFPHRNILMAFTAASDRETLTDLWSGKESGTLVCDWLCRWLAFFVFPWESGTLIPLRSHCAHCSHHNWTKRNSYNSVESNTLILYRFFLLIKVVRLLVIIQVHLRILQRLISHLKWREQQ